MKNICKILAAFALMIFLTNSTEAADLKINTGKNLVELKHVTPPNMRRIILPPLPKTPRKDYIPRQPYRPKPHYLPQVPKPTNDNRGGKRKNFGPPRAPQR